MHPGMVLKLPELVLPAYSSTRLQLILCSTDGLLDRAEPTLEPKTMGLVLQTCVFDPPYHRCCYPCGKYCCGALGLLCCFKTEEAGSLPENDGDFSRVLERKTKNGKIFHIWEWEPVQFVRRWSTGKPYYTNLEDENSTWDRPKGFGNPPKKPKFFIIYSHGRREDVTLFSPRYRLQNLAWNLEAACYMYEWPGYAKSSGMPTEENVFQSIEGTYKYLIEERHAKPSQIILYGMSLGSGPTCWLASKYPVGGIIVQSGFTSICRVVSSHCGCKGYCMCCVPGCSFCCDLFDNLGAVNKIRCPVFILHSKEDEVIPIEHANHMLDALGPKAHRYILETSKHDFFPVHTLEYAERLKGFLSSLERMEYKSSLGSGGSTIIDSVPEETDIEDEKLKDE